MAKFLDYTGLSTYDGLMKQLIATYGKSIDVSINTTTYVMTIALKDANGNTLSTGSVDLPLESVVLSGSYDNTTQSLILTLVNGSTISIPISGLISGLASTGGNNSFTGNNSFFGTTNVRAMTIQGAIVSDKPSGNFKIAYGDGETTIQASKSSGSATLTLPSTTGTLALTTDIPSNVVTLDGTQTITGNKTFTGSSTFSGGANFGGTSPAQFANQVNISSVIDGVPSGRINLIYGPNATKTTLKATKATSGDIEISLPSSAGTLALTSDMVAITTSEINSLFS